MPCRCVEGPTRELRAVVGAYGARVATETSGLVQHADHVGATDAVIHRNVDAFVAEVVGDGEALEPTTIG